MNMRKITALLAASLMILSLFPVFAASAVDVQGDWDTSRKPKEYAPEKAESYRPAPGYVYTDEGFQTVPADYTNTKCFFTVQTREKHPVKDGIYMKVRIDDFTYGGETNADHWISFHIWDKARVDPGGLTHGSGWMCLLRGPGSGGNAGLESCIMTENTDVAAGSRADVGQVGITPEVEDDKEIYVFSVVYDEGAYALFVNDIEVPGGDKITEKLDQLDPNGEFYIGISLNCGEQGSKGSLTIMKFGKSEADATVPTGSDSKDPEENFNKPPADLMDASTIPEKQPALLFDATHSSFLGDPSVQNMKIEAQGDNSHKCIATGGAPFVVWNIKRDLSYALEDFPVFAAVLRNYWGPGGTLYYCAGDIIAAQNDYMLTWDAYDENNKNYGDDEEYLLVIIDLDGLYEGRINTMRPSFSIDDPSDPDSSTFDIMWMGMFRNVEEAVAYTDNTMKEQGHMPSVKTEAPTDTPTEAPPTEAPTGETPTEAPTEAPTGEAPTEAPTEKPDEKKGCSSAAGFGAAALLTAAAATFALRKKSRL